MYKSPYNEQRLPRDLSIPDFVFRHLDQEKDQALVLHPSPFTTRPDARPLSLLDVRQGAYAIAASLLSPEYPGGPWKKGEVVLFLSENQVRAPIHLQHDYLMVCLGVILAGGIPALLNPQFTGQELITMMQKVKPRAVFASSATFAGAQHAIQEYAQSAPEPQLYVFDEAHERSLQKLLREPGEGVPHDRIHVTCDPVSDAAVYCFSSGTSGMPKVVRLSHHNMIANTIQTVAMLGGRMNKPRFDDAGWYDQPLLPPQDGTHEFHLSILPQFHCYGLLMAIASLHTATPCVTFSRFNIDHFFETVQKFRVTFMFVVPPMLLALSSSPLAEKYDISSIKSFASGAASLSNELCDLVYKKHRIPVTDGYGMTEMSPLIALQTEADIKRHHLDVGRLVPNTEARVVDVVTGKDSKPGEPGELWLRGPQMMLGYLDNDEANAKAFTPDTTDPERYFKSGDVVSIDSQGMLPHSLTQVT